MKPHTLPVKRRPVPKGIFRRLSAVTRNRKQRVAATATAADLEAEDGGSRISRALTIIFLIHIVAIGLIFVHQRFLDGRSPVIAEAAKTAKAPPLPSTSQSGELPRFSNGEKPYIVRTGDNYARIAAAEQVDEAELRAINNHADIVPKLLLKIPPKRIVAEDPPEVAAMRKQASPDHDPVLVEAVDVSSAPKAQLIRPASSHEAPAPQALAANPTAGKPYVVQPGDSVWRIANRFKVTQDVLMRANGISDARKLKTGMKLTIPQG